MQIFLSKEAKQKLEETEEEAEEEIEEALKIIEEHPTSNDNTKYIDHPEYGRLYRYKVKREHADHRIFFRISDDGKEIDVVTVLHRDVAYDYKK